MGCAVSSLMRELDLKTRVLHCQRGSEELFWDCTSVETMSEAPVGVPEAPVGSSTPQCFHPSGTGKLLREAHEIIHHGRYGGLFRPCYERNSSARLPYQLIA